MALSRCLCAALVGREAELSRLEDALLATLRGDGGVVIIGGEAGTGKTRLVSALAERARRLGCVVVAGACSEAELSLPYLPFLEAVGNHLATEDVAQLRDRLGSAADELAQLFPQMGRPLPVVGDAGQVKFRLYESILLLLRDAARKRALMLILEDLQWADPATRELLDYATRRLGSVNVLVVATYRTDEMHRKHALLPTIQGWRRSGVAEVIEIAPLDAAAVGEMVCAIFEEQRITDEFRDLLHARSEGNPFVLEEMLRDLLDRGDIFQTDGGWDRRALVELRIPRSVQDSILHRLERLAREHVDVLSAAATVGRSFDLATLVSVTGMPESDVLAALEAAVTYQLVEEESRASSRYRFRHALTREAVYEDMVVPRRQQLHGRIANAMKETQGALPIDLANHLLLAARFEEAVAMCVEAATKASQAYAFHDAGQLLERAAPHVHDLAARGRILYQAAEAYWRNDEAGAARAILEQSVADLEAAGLPLEAAVHRLLLGRCFWELNRSSSARKEFEAARDVLEAAGPSEALANAYNRLSLLATINMDSEVGLTQARKAIDIADRAGAGLAKAWGYGFLALAEVNLGDVDQGFVDLERSFLESEAGGHLLQMGNAVYNAAFIAFHLGDGGRLAQWERRLPQVPEAETGLWGDYMRGMCDLAFGRVAAAGARAQASLTVSREMGNAKNVWRSSVLLAAALAENLRVQEAIELMPPLSTRVDRQDVIYDTAARVRRHLANSDLAAAFEDAKTVDPADCTMVAPADAVAEAALDPVWLRGFLESLPVRVEASRLARFPSAHGRLALLEGRLDDALGLLRAADAGFREGKLMLDAWHLGRALVEAEFRCGLKREAGLRLAGLLAEADAAGAHLAARLAREKAASLGMEVAPPPAPREADSAGAGPHLATGERLVTVMFVDVRGYTESSARMTPAENAERIASLQRWATQEVGRRHGVVDKFAGDAVMATFNISGQSVDHTVQAVHAAVAIIDKATLGGLPVGAGVAVGPAVVGNLAEGANLSVLGEVTNLAARLQSAAGAGEIYLSAEAHLRARDWLAAQRLAAEPVSLDLKGFGSPVTAFRIGSSLAVRAPI